MAWLACATVLAWPAAARAGEASHADAHAAEASAAASTEPSIKPKLKPDLKAQLQGDGRGEGKSVRGEVKSEPAPAPTAKAESKSEGKAEAKAETKAEAKSESKGSAKEESASASKAEGKSDSKGDSKAESKAEAKGEAKEPEAKPAMSMATLREVLDQKIAEVRAKQMAAPVVKVRSRGGKSERVAMAHNPATAAEPAGMAHASGAGSQGGHGAEAHAAWSYSGPNGPEHWADLKPEFAQCGIGQRQSPIDISDGIPVELDPIAFDYRPSTFRVIDNGHTVQVNLAPGNRITVNGRRYDLLQFHFHRPSEERLNGKQFDMVVHLVHKDIDGKLGVVAVLISEGKGHPLVQQVWNNLPLEQFIEQPGLGTIDLNQLLPEKRQYLTFMGSLTTPPCSEGVLWMVLKQPVTISPEQLSIFGRLYPMNARPVQRTSGRLIKDGQ